MTDMNRVWRLRKRPVGVIADDVLSLEQEPIPEPAEGQFSFRLNYLSLDPTNRIWMSDMDQYMPPVAVGDPMRGVVCGTVVKSKQPGFAAGDSNGHHLVNRSARDAAYLEVGDRTPGDAAAYPDDDIAAKSVDGGWQFTRKDGTPY